MQVPRGVANLVRLELHSYSLQELSRLQFEKFGARGALVRHLNDSDPTPQKVRLPLVRPYTASEQLDTSPDAASGPRARAQAEERGLRVGDCVLHAELLRPSHASSGGRRESPGRIRLLVARPLGGGRYIDAVGSRPTSLLLPPPAAPHAQPEAVQCASTNMHPATTALPSVAEPPAEDEEPSAAQAAQESSSRRSPPLRNYYLEARHRGAAYRQAHVFDVLVARASSAEPLGLLIAAYSFVDVRYGSACVQWGGLNVEPLSRCCCCVQLQCSVTLYTVNARDVQRASTGCSCSA